MKAVSIAVLLALSTLSKASPTHNVPRAAILGTKYIFSFGDSYSETKFNLSGTKPSKYNPFGNPAFPGVTTSGGMNWLGQLITTYNTSLTLDYNFAWGGATVDSNLVAPYIPTVKSFVEQIATFTSNFVPTPSYAAWKGGNSLFAMWIGINDVGTSYARANEAALISQIMDQYFAQVQTLFGVGARYFLFLTVPPIDRTPRTLALPAASQALQASVVAEYNRQLVSRVAAFHTANPLAHVWVYDTQVPFNTALNNPTAYGAPDAVCSSNNGLSCLWWGSYHAGIVMQRLVAQGVASLLKGSFF